jgi:hypothetical protein
MAQENWEYRVVSIDWNEETQSYGAEFSDTGLLTGVGNILSRYGGRGYELVSLTANRWSDARVLTYYAVFKRPG